MFDILHTLAPAVFVIAILVGALLIATHSDPEHGKDRDSIHR